MIAWAFAVVQNGHLSNMEIGIKNQIFPEKPEVGIFIPINWFGSCSENFFAGMKLTLHKSQVHSLCHAVMSLQFTHVSSFACRGVLRKSRVDCSTVGLYRVTIPWQQTCKSSRYITVAGVLLPETVERTHILAGNAARHRHADSGKPRTFTLCEKKHEWVNRNASTSLKNPLLVRVRPVRLSVKLQLCRLLFIQYKITWLVRMHLCRLVGIRLNC